MRQSAERSKQSFRRVFSVSGGMADSSAPTTQNQTLSHQPGVASMPPWTVGELPEAPRLTLRSWAMLLGPGAFVPALPLEQLLQPQTEDEIADFILAMQDQTPAPVVLTGIVGSTAGGPLPSPGEDITPVAAGAPKSVTKMSLVYLTPDEAAAAVEQIENRLATGDSMAQKRPWTELFTSWSAVQGADPSTVLVTLEWVGVPRSLELVFNRDMSFITG